MTRRRASEYAAVAAQLASCHPYPRALKARSVAAPHRADAPIRASVPHTRRPYVRPNSQKSPAMVKRLVKFFSTVTMGTPREARAAKEVHTIATKSALTGAHARMRGQEGGSRAPQGEEEGGGGEMG